MSEANSPAKPAETKTESSVDRFKGLVAVVVAVLILVGFTVLMIFLSGQVHSANDTSWSRYLYLFGAAEAIVFTAVGWLFGQEVNRKAANEAGARADGATAKAEDAAVLAAAQTAKGEALRAGIEARAAGATPGIEERGGLGDEEPAAVAGPGQMQDLVTLARTLFP